jgi:hypothetical protein
MEAMRTLRRINEATYGALVAKSPRPIRTHAEHLRLTQMLLEFDERDDLSPEEEALAEVLTLLIEAYDVKLPDASSFTH